jgi:hypothetical protein
MADSSFFDESRDNSLVKAEIVAKYFWAWAKVIIQQPGNGVIKLPILICSLGLVAIKTILSLLHYLSWNSAIRDPDMSQMLVTLFNDKDSNNTQSLQQAIELIPDISRLRL